MNNNEMFFELRYILAMAMYFIVCKIIKMIFISKDSKDVSNVTKVALLHFMNSVIYLVLIVASCIVVVIDNEIACKSVIVFVLVSAILCIYNIMQLISMIKDGESNFKDTYTDLMLRFSKSIYNNNKRYMDSPNTRYHVCVITCLVPLLNYIIIRSGDGELLRNIVDGLNLLDYNKSLKEIKEDYEMSIYIQLKHIEDTNLKEEIINESKEFFDVLRQSSIDYSLKDIMKYKEKDDNAVNGNN